MKKDNEILDAIFGDTLEFINNSNILILKCFKFIFGYITDSFGALFSLICLFIHIILTVLFFTKEFEKIKIYIFNITEKYLSFLLKFKSNAPPKKKINNIKKSEKIIHEKLNTNNKISNFKESNIIIKENNSDSNSKSDNVLSVNAKEKNSSKNLIIINSKKIENNNLISEKLNSKFSIVDKANKKFFEEYLKTSLDNLEFDDALVKDKRSFCEYFAESFKDRQDIANTFFASDPIKTRTIKIILFIFDTSINFVINALFITEEYISEIYHLDDNESFFEFVPRSISRFIKTTLVGEVIGYVSNFFFIEENKIKSLFKREKENKIAIKQEIITLIIEIKKRYIGFIVFVYIIIIISFFYLLCFNFVYPYTQIEWIKTSVMVIIIRQILSCLIILFETCLRYLSFKIKSEKLYKFSKIFN